jgi:hypothetical protein
LLEECDKHSSIAKLAERDAARARAAHLLIPPSDGAMQTIVAHHFGIGSLTPIFVGFDQRLTLYGKRTRARRLSSTTKFYVDDDNKHTRGDDEIKKTRGASSNRRLRSDLINRNITNI